MFADFPDSRHCIPLLTREDDNETGSRIGGLPPDGIVPPRPDRANYLMTLAVSPRADQEVSVFLNFDEDATVFIKGRNILHTNGSLISFVVHPASRRATESPSEPILSSHRIDRLPLIRDTWAERHKWRDEFAGLRIVEVDGEPLAPGEEGITCYRHNPNRNEVYQSWLTPEEAAWPAGWTKLGGAPHFGEDNGIGAAFHDRLVESGYVLFLQLNHFMEDWPVSGSWPFGDNEFFAYARRTADGYDWAYFWGPLC